MKEQVARLREGAREGELLVQGAGERWRGWKTDGGPMATKINSRNR
jgi:hypothetical protein